MHKINKLYIDPTGGWQDELRIGPPLLTSSEPPNMAPKHGVRNGISIKTQTPQHFPARHLHEPSAIARSLLHISTVAVAVLRTFCTVLFRTHFRRPVRARYVCVCGLGRCQVAV